MGKPGRASPLRDPSISLAGRARKGAGGGGRNQSYVGTYSTPETMDDLILVLLQPTRHDKF